MSLGFSGAQILIQDKTVVKHMQYAHLQSAYCKTLGTSVCPEILQEYPNHYEMERLYEDGAIRLLSIRNLLIRKVWNRQPIGNIDGWHSLLSDWLYEQRETKILDKFHTLYKNEAVQNYSLIHGDPTLSNAMYDKNGMLRLIDPIKPMGKIPPLREVDIGKMLQSYIGWEGLMSIGTPFVLHKPVRDCSVLSRETKEIKDKSVFWLSVHLLRILPYAKAKNREDIIKQIHEAKHVCL